MFLICEEVLLGLSCLTFCIAVIFSILSGVPRYMDEAEVRKRFSGKKLKYHKLALKLLVVSLISLILTLICKLF